MEGMTWAQLSSAQHKWMRIWNISFLSNVLDQMLVDGNTAGRQASFLPSKASEEICCFAFCHTPNLKWATNKGKQNRYWHRSWHRSHRRYESSSWTRGHHHDNIQCGTETWGSLTVTVRLILLVASLLQYDSSYSWLVGQCHFTTERRARKPFIVDVGLARLIQLGLP
jgi:hypothetical protein